MTRISSYHERDKLAIFHNYERLICRNKHQENKRLVPRGQWTEKSPDPASQIAGSSAATCPSNSFPSVIESPLPAGTRANGPCGAMQVDPFCSNRCRPREKARRCWPCMYYSTRTETANHVESPLPGLPGRTLSPTLLPVVHSGDRTTRKPRGPCMSLTIRAWMILLGETTLYCSREDARSYL